VFVLKAENFYFIILVQNTRTHGVCNSMVSSTESKWNIVPLG
jgi:hypothetical protein